MKMSCPWEFWSKKVPIGVFGRACVSHTTCLEFESLLRQAYDVETGIERTLIVTDVMPCLC